MVYETTDVGYTVSVAQSREPNVSPTLSKQSVFTHDYRSLSGDGADNPVWSSSAVAVHTCTSQLEILCWRYAAGDALSQPDMQGRGRV